MNMKVQILSRKLIAPSSPTPPNLQNLKISCFDQLAPPTYVPCIFYYPVSGEDHGGNNADRSKKVEKSLAETLTLFYPLGGRYIEENLSIECNDDGAEYLEAQVSGSLSQLLGREEFKTEMWWRLVPQVFRPENNPPLTIQFNRFECGGVAIGSCVAHRIADAYTVGTFINTWAAACRMGIGKVHRRPGFPFGSLFPPKNIPATTSVDDLISAGAIKKQWREKERDAYIVNSWCRMPWYENFGWGKPSWVHGVDAAASPGTVTLMDTEDGGGIEAFLGLDGSSSLLFQQNLDVALTGN